MWVMDVRDPLKFGYADLNPFGEDLRMFGFVSGIERSLFGCLDPILKKWWCTR